MKTLLVNEAASQTTHICDSAEGMPLPSRINDLKHKFQSIDNELRDNSIGNKEDLISVVGNLEDIAQNIFSMCSRIENKLKETNEPEGMSHRSNNFTLHSNVTKKVETVQLTEQEASSYKWKCDTCDNMFHSPTFLSDHISVVHEGE